MTPRLLPVLAAIVLMACSPPQAETASAVAPVKQPAVMAANAGISLASPLACEIGTACLIQQYADHDPTTGAQRDYTCGHAVYDGHDGTDFRLPDKQAQMRGVAVLAVADGVVAGVRDGEPDWEAGAYNQTAIPSNRACGNRVFVLHANGWESQYCHLRRGSVAVTDGQKVRAGDTLALVGQSGWAQFPHLHLTVRKDKKPVDPFGTDAGCNPDIARTLWRPEVQPQMAYRGRQVLNAGFAAAPVTMDDIERGGIASPVASSPALVAWVRAVNLAQGDVQTLTLHSPDGKELARSTGPPLERNKAQYQMFAGQKLTVTAWPKGAYRAAYEVTREGQVILRHGWTERIQ